jgi:Flp pilus assembly protein TadG
VNGATRARFLWVRAVVREIERGVKPMRLFRRDRGAALVEAALVLPFLLLLTFGIWTTARAWNIHNTMEHAAREAARFGATVEPWDPDPAGSPASVRAVADADMSSAAIDTTAIDDVCIELISDGASSCDGTHTNDTGTDQIFVKLRYPSYELQFLFFSIDVDMEASAISRHEAAP